MNISVEITGNILKYLDAKVNSGMFKSRSEVVREAIREMVQRDLLAQLEAKGITIKDVEKLRDEVAPKLIERKYGKKPKNNN